MNDTVHGRIDALADSAMASILKEPDSFAVAAAAMQVMGRSIAVAAADRNAFCQAVIALSEDLIRNAPEFLKHQSRDRVAWLGSKGQP